MPIIETGRSPASRPALRRRATEMVVLGSANLAFLFALAVAFGFVTG